MGVANTNIQLRSDANRSNATSPIQRHSGAMPTFREREEDYIGRPREANYQFVKGQVNQIPIWTQQSSQYSEIWTGCNIQQSPMCQSRPYSLIQCEQTLSSIHDSQSQPDKTFNGMDTNWSTGMSSCPPLPEYGPSATRMELQNGAINTEAGLYYDQLQRQIQTYPSIVRYNGSNIDYQSQYPPHYDQYRLYHSYGGLYADVDYQSQTTLTPHLSNFNTAGENVDSCSKRRRGNLPKPVTDILKAWLHEHLNHPYPTEEDKQQFKRQTGLTHNQQLVQQCPKTTTAVFTMESPPTGASKSKRPLLEPRIEHEATVAFPFASQDEGYQRSISIFFGQDLY